MLIDLHAMGDGACIEADICVVGAGAAGIALAVPLIGSRCQVCLLESGGVEFEPETQALYDGQAVGVPWGTGLATSRVRQLGGTTNRWPGGCIPLDAMDFRARPWVPHSGWPIARSDLDPWYRRAASLLGLRPVAWDEGGPIDRPAPWLQFDPDKLVHRAGIGVPEPRLGVAYRAALAAAENVRLVLHANLVELAVTPSATAVSEARLKTLDGKTCRVRARAFVLACGGIENARLLLLSNAVLPQGLGNANGLVGRFFMDHPGAKLGSITSDTPAALTDPYNRQVYVPGVPRPGEISLSRSIQATQRLLTARLRPQDYENESAVPDGVIAAREFKASLRHGRLPEGAASLAWRMLAGSADILPGLYRRLRGEPVVPSHRIDLEGFFEQAPNPHSRVMLADTRDALGLRQVRLEWRLTELDRHTYRAAAFVFSEELARLGMGTLQPDEWLRPDAAGDPLVRGMAHHLGTTRMSDDPREGVVDRNCRVHDIDNLYVVGGSVFPTGGWAPPTFTIVSLAIRLADHLAAMIEEADRPGDAASGAMQVDDHLWPAEQ